MAKQKKVNLSLPVEMIDILDQMVAAKNATQWRKTYFKSDIIREILESELGRDKKKERENA